MIEIPMEFDADGFPLITYLNLNIAKVPPLGQFTMGENFVSGDYRKIIKALENRESFGAFPALVPYDATRMTDNKIKWFSQAEIIEKMKPYGLKFYNPFLVINASNYTAYKEAWKRERGQ